jgi:hypothetical protein
MMQTPTIVAKTVIEILAEDKNKKWSLDKIALEIGNRIAYSNTNRAKVIIKGLCGGGRVNYHPTYATKHPQYVWHKDLADESTLDLKDHQIAHKVHAIEVLNRKISELEQEVVQAKTSRVEDRIVEVRTYKKANSKPTVTTGLFHKEFQTVVDLSQARMNVFIYGPTGCGKSHICGQVAKALGLSFAFVSCTSGMSEGVLGGRLLPVGTGGKFAYVISEFVKAYEQGGVFLLDEIDAADPNVLLLVNSALANGHISVPNRPGEPYAKRHPDFVCMAAANTVGTGASRTYSGRNKLDAATLDRFQIGKVHMDYDERVEQGLCPDENLYQHCLAIRAAINEHRLERAMSTRFMKDAYQMQEAGWDFYKIDRAFFQGWREDELNKIKGSCTLAI